MRLNPQLTMGVGDFPQDLYFTLSLACFSVEIVPDFIPDISTTVAACYLFTPMLRSEQSTVVGNETVPDVTLL